MLIAYQTILLHAPQLSIPLRRGLVSLGAETNGPNEVELKMRSPRGDPLLEIGACPAFANPDQRFLHCILPSPPLQLRPG